MTESQRGAVYVSAASTVWGFFPVYFKLLVGIVPGVVLGHRIVWSCVFFLLLLAVSRRLAEAWQTICNARLLGSLVLSACLIALNWLTYLSLVAAGHILEASLAYFLTPLLSIVLGVVFLHEPLRRGQWLAVALAAGGVLQLFCGADGVPWVALFVALSFGLYGLVRKRLPVDPTVASTVESGVLVLPALLFLTWEKSGPSPPATAALLVGSGVITALPLLWFSHGARRLPLSTLGFFQYLSPTLQFLLAVVVYGEPFGLRKACSFVCIWAALIVFTIEAQYVRRRRRALEHA